MTNNSNIYIENYVSVDQSSDHEYTEANITCAVVLGLGALAGLGALGFSLSLAAELALELMLDVAYGLGNMVGTVTTGVLDIAKTVGHLVSISAVPAFWIVGSGCLTLVGLAILARFYEIWQEWRESRPVRMVEQPQLLTQRVLVLVASPEQLDEATKLLSGNASVEYIQILVRKETANV